VPTKTKRPRPLREYESHADATPEERARLSQLFSGGPTPRWDYARNEARRLGQMDGHEMETERRKRAHGDRFWGRKPAPEEPEWLDTVRHVAAQVRQGWGHRQRVLRELSRQCSPEHPNFRDYIGTEADRARCKQVKGKCPDGPHFHVTGDSARGDYLLPLAPKTILNRLPAL
jgi:hypothetical protein